MVKNTALRRFILVIALITGFAVLVWGISSLHAIFYKEMADAISKLEKNNNTLEEFALKSLKLVLRQKLVISRNAIIFTANDPLAIDPGYLFFDKGQQILPRVAVYLPESDLTIQELYEQIYNADPIDLIVDNLSIWSQQRSHYSNIKLAIEHNDMEEIRTSFRSIRDLRARHPMDVRLEIPFMLAVIDFLVNNSSPSKPLVKGALRGGTIVDQENGRYGLQRSLLMNRNRFTLPEYNFLRDKIFYLSRFAEAKYDDFLTRSKDTLNPLGIPVDNISAPSLLFNGSWYVEPEHDKLIGLKISINESMSNVYNEMILLGLIDEDVQISLESLSGDFMPVSDLSIKLHWPSQVKIIRSIRDNYYLKTSLLAVLVIFVVSIVLLTWYIQKRQHRYLNLKADFMAAVTHELRTPLASMRLMAETLQRRLKGEEKAKDYPQRIVRDVDNMGYLVDNILSFNKLSKDLWETKREEQNLDELLVPMIKEMELVYGKKINLHWISGRDCRILADPELCKILFSNLLSNSAKYNNHDSVEIEIKCIGDPASTILFQDNGMGIQQADWERVFHEFIRLPNNKDMNIRGVGLGLALCKQIMELHHGSIRISYSSHQGTGFELIFDKDA